MTRSNKNLPILARPAFLCLLLLLTAGVIYLAWSFLHVVLLGVFIAIVMQPVHRWIADHICPPFRKHRDGKIRRMTRVFYFISFHAIRPVLRRIRAKFPSDSRNPIVICCDQLTSTPTEMARAAICRRRLVAVLLTVIILMLGIAAPCTFFIKEAASQTSQVIQQTMSGLRNGNIQQHILELYRKPALRNYIRKIEQSHLGNYVFRKTAEYLDSPNLKSSLDSFFNSLADEELPELPEIFQDNQDEAELSKEDGDQASASPETVSPPQVNTGAESPESLVPEAAEIDEDEEEIQPRLLILDKLEPLLMVIGKKSLTLLQHFSIKLLSLTGSLAVKGLILIFTLFFALYRGRFACNFLRRVSPMDAEDFDLITTKIASTSQTILWGGLCGVVVQALFAMLGFWIVGLPCIFLGLLCMVCAIIPFIGSSLVWLPAAIYLATFGQIKAAIFLVLWGALVVSNIDGLVRPWVMSRWKNSNLSFAIVFFSLLGGLRAFGIIGLIYGPIIACLFVAALQIYAAKYKYPENAEPDHANDHA